jgi:hypothetical protein
MQRNDKLLVYSFLSLNLFQWISIVEIKYGIPAFVKYILSVFVLGTLIYNLISAPSKPKYGKIFYAVIIIFILWSIYILVAAALKFTSTFYIQRVLGQRYFYLPYLIPLLILYTKFDIEFFSYYFHFTYKLIILALVIQLSVIFLGISREDWYEQTHRIGIFDIGSGLLLLMAHISRKKQISYVILLYFIIAVFIFSYYGRRGPLVENLLLMVFMIILRIRSPFSQAGDRKIIYFYVFLLMIILLLTFGNLVRSIYVFQRGFNQDAWEASRGNVMEDFLTDFISRTDWIFGRGIDGTILRTISADGIEKLIENGFLTIILKGGLLYLIPMLIILLRACFLGFFKSSNDLAKALAALIFIHIISMFSFGLPDYSVHYILIWISASVCFSDDIRNISNEELYQAINPSYSC